MSASLFVRNRVPVYSTPRAEVNGVVMLLNPKGGGVSLHEAGSGKLIRETDLGDTNGPRLHPDGWLYWTDGRRLMRATNGVASLDYEAVHEFASPITIGGNEGDFDQNFRLLPILRGEFVGILNILSGRYIETHAGPGIDWAQVGAGRTLAVARRDPPGSRGAIESYAVIRGALRRRGNFAPALGHSDVTMIDGRPTLVTTTSDWVPPYTRPGEWLVAIDMATGALTPIRATGWRAQHIACWREWVCVSFYSAGIPPGDHPGEIWVGRIGGGGVGQVVAIADLPATVEYIDQPHAAWSADGRSIYYGQRGDTYVVDVAAITGAAGGPPTADVPPGSPPPPRRRLSFWERLLGSIRDWFR